MKMDIQQRCEYDNLYSWPVFVGVKIKFLDRKTNCQQTKQMAKTV